MLNCPVCGAAAPTNLKYIKLMVCEHCKTSLFLEDEAVKHVGKKSAINEVPSIFSLGHRYRYRKMTFEPIGRIQFDYGQGFWDEWWVMSDTGNGKWISVDEGDIAIESEIDLKTALEKDEVLPDCDELVVGKKVKLTDQFVEVTEINSSTCIGFEGLLPEVIFPGEKHNYAHCSGKSGLLLTLECFDGHKQLFKGSWVDPFDVEPL